MKEKNTRRIYGANNRILYELALKMSKTKSLQKQLLVHDTCMTPTICVLVQHLGIDPTGQVPSEAYQIVHNWCIYVIFSTTARTAYAAPKLRNRFPHLSVRQHVTASQRTPIMERHFARLITISTVDQYRAQWRQTQGNCTTLDHAVANPSHKTPDAITSSIVKVLRQHNTPDPEVLAESKSNSHSAASFRGNYSTLYGRKCSATKNRLGKHEGSTTNTIFVCTNPAYSNSINEN